MWKRTMFLAVKLNLGWYATLTPKEPFHKSRRVHWILIKFCFVSFSRHLEINQISSNAKVAQIFPPWDTFHTYNEHDLESFFGWFSWRLKIKNHVSFWPKQLSVWSDDNTNHWHLSQHARTMRSGTPVGSRDLEPRNI